MNPTSTAQHHPLEPHLLPRLVRSGRRARLGHVIPASAIRLAAGINWIPDPGAQRWEHRYTLSLARAMAAHATHPSIRCLSHASAALILGLPMMSQEPDVYLSVPRPPRRISSRLPVVTVPLTGTPSAGYREGCYCRQVMAWSRILDLAEEEIVVVGGLAVTSALRTAFDCAFDEPAHNALAIADAALRLYCGGQRQNPQACKQAEEQARQTWRLMLQRHASRRGIAQARAVLAAASPLAESPAESAVRWMALALGLPAPRLQRRIETRIGRYWVDLCWPELGLIIEVDGRVKYESREDAWQEKQRQDAIQAEGWRFLRVTYEDFFQPRVTVPRILGVFPPDVVTTLTAGEGLVWPGTDVRMRPREGSMLALRRR